MKYWNINTADKGQDYIDACLHFGVVCFSGGKNGGYEENLEFYHRNAETFQGVWPLTLMEDGDFMGDDGRA